MVDHCLERPTDHSSLGLLSDHRTSIKAIRAFHHLIDILHWSSLQNLKFKIGSVSSLLEQKFCWNALCFRWKRTAFRMRSTTIYHSLKLLGYQPAALLFFERFSSKTVSFASEAVSFSSPFIRLSLTGEVYHHHFLFKSSLSSEHAVGPLKASLIWLQSFLT